MKQSNDLTRRQSEIPSKSPLAKSVLTGKSGNVSKMEQRTVNDAIRVVNKIHSENA